MFEKRWAKRGLILFTFFFLFCYTLQIDAFARVGGGRSMGSRGSRTYTAPRTMTPGPSQTSPSGQYTQPATPPMGQPLPQTGGFMRGLAGGVIGGMIGGMLFRSLGFAGPGMGGGIGLMDIVLIGLILYGIYWFVKRRRKEAASGAYYRATTADSAGASASAPPVSGGPGGQAFGGDLDLGLGHIRQMDPYFEEKKFTDLSMDYFFRVQGAWADRDMSSVKALLTDEMFGILQGDAERLRSGKRINKLDNIAVRSADITEAWQEGGKDFLTIRFYANLLDYTVDETTGQVVEGSRKEPVKFEEYWTFSRPVGGNPWQLAAINQAQ